MEAKQREMRDSGESFGGREGKKIKQTEGGGNEFLGLAIEGRKG